MGPVCVATATQVALGAASAGVWTPHIVEKLRSKINSSNFPAIKKPLLDDGRHRTLKRFSAQIRKEESA
jgi:hypothetical protein